MTQAREHASARTKHALKEAMALRMWIRAFFSAAMLIVAEASAPAAELPTLQAGPKPPVESPSESGKNFDIPDSGLHVTYGGYIEGAVSAVIPKSTTGGASRRPRPTPQSR
jgi:hypothetical protein